MTVCKVESITDIDMTTDFFFIGKTDEEISLVCKTDAAPEKTIERDDGWKGFRIQGILDFSLIGILSKLSGILAEKSRKKLLILAGGEGAGGIKQVAARLYGKSRRPHYLHLACGTAF